MTPSSQALLEVWLLVWTPSRMQQAPQQGPGPGCTRKGGSRSRQRGRPPVGPGAGLPPEPS